MRYCIADIHGCYREYLALLKEIHFSDEDQLYVLGDAVDRGPEPMRLMLDLMRRKNVHFIMGNHEYLFRHMVRTLGMSLECAVDQEDLDDFNDYLADGGHSTVLDFLRLRPADKQAVIDYLDAAACYAQLTCGKQRYILVHAGIADFNAEKPLESYRPTDFLCERLDYHRRYYPDRNTHIISGHTPTPLIEYEGEPDDYIEEIYRGYGHIAIDCGCINGGLLAALCLETGEETYIRKQ